MEAIDPKIYGLVLGKVVASLRTKRGISQDQLAARIGVSQPTMSRIERGQVLPDALTFRRIAFALGMSEAELNQRVDQAITRTQELARSVLKTKKNSSDPWKEILGIVGLAALAGLVVFAVAAIIDEIDRSPT